MKNLKFYLVIAALIIGLLYVGYQWYQDSRSLKVFEATKREVTKQILTGAKEISRVVKANGTEAVLLDITGNRTSNKNADKTDIPDIVDTAALALDIRTKQLKEVTQIAAQYKAENLQLKAQLDSGHHLYYTYEANGLKLKFTPPYDTVKNATADFLGTFGVTLAQGYKRQWFLGKEKSLLSVSSDSPYFKINKVNYVGFDRAPPDFGLQAKWKASFNNIAGPASGPALSLKLGRFDLEGDFQYYINNKSWSWGASTEFTIGKL